MDRLGIERLSEMQSDTYEKITGTVSDVVVVSPTGSGKTLAFLLPLAEMLDSSSLTLQAVVVSPSRELAQQSARVLDSLRLGIKYVCCHGGRSAMEEHRMIKDVCPQVVFGTPGRLNDHISKGNLSPYGVRTVVIDEFDKCLEFGWSEEAPVVFCHGCRANPRFCLYALSGQARLFGRRNLLARVAVCLEEPH